jgi:hypothetical protein
MQRWIVQPIVRVLTAVRTLLRLPVQWRWSAGVGPRSRQRTLPRKPPMTTPGSPRHAKLQRARPSLRPSVASPRGSTAAAIKLWRCAAEKRPSRSISRKPAWTTSLRASRIRSSRSVSFLRHVPHSGSLLRAVLPVHADTSLDCEGIAMGLDSGPAHRGAPSSRRGCRRERLRGFVFFQKIDLETGLGGLRARPVRRRATERCP